MKKFKADRIAYTILVLLLVLISRSFFLLAQVRPNISDTIGYVHAGRRLAIGDGPTYIDENNQVAGPYFSLFSFPVRRSDDPRMYLGYPPGFPILLAGAVIVTGKLEAIHYVVPLLAVLGLLATFWLGRLLGKSAWDGLWAAGLVALTPDFWEYGTSSWSATPSLTLITAGVLLFLLSHAERRSRSRVIVFSTVGGTLIGFSFFVRYSNVTVVPALMLYELASGRYRALIKQKRWPFWSILALGLAAIPVLNHFYYGGALQTGYSPTHGWYPWPAFSLSYALGPSPANGYSLIEAAKTLWSNFPILLLAMPVGWLLLPRRSALLLAPATAGMVALYAIYAFAPAGVNRRFLLPVFPFISVAIAHALVSIGKQFPGRKQRWVTGILIAVALCLPIPGRLDQLATRNLGDTRNANYVHDLVAWSPPNAVFLSYVYNDHIAFYGGRSVLNYRRIPPSDPEAGRYQMETLEPCLVQTVDRLLESGTPVFYIEDKSPPFWDSLAILQRHYAMELVRSNPSIFQIHLPVQKSRDVVGACSQ